MKKFFIVALLFLALPVLVWAAEPTNAELYKMFKALEVKLDKAINEANKAKAEANHAKKEAAKAKKEAAKAKEELARIKSTPTGASTESLLKATDTKPGVMGFAEALYIRPSRSGLDYVVEDKKQTGPDRIEGDYKSVEPGYDWGARVGVAYDFGGGTDIGLRYSWLENKERDSISIDPATSDLWGIWLHANSIIDDNDVTDAHAAYELQYSVFDLTLGQTVDIGKRFGLRLEGGLRYAEIDQDMDIYYNQQITAVLNRSADIDYKNEFSGWGGRLGLGLDWRVGWGINVFASAAGSVMVGDFDMDLSQLDTDTAGATTQRVDTSETYKNRVIPVVETRAGIGYAYTFENGWTFGGMAGYEWHNWFNMVTARHYTDDVDSQLSNTDTTDLGFDGYFFELFLHF